MIRKMIGMLAVVASIVVGAGIVAACDPSKPAPASSANSVVQLTAAPTAFTPSVLNDGGAYTSVLVTVTNNRTDKAISVNPLYFAITDTGGSKHTAELGVEENQIATVELQPGEKVTGAVAAKGTFTPKTVVFDNMTDKVRADVS
ncbi:DUF4352 domain-containing protein [Nocardia niigatensis]|uniref:DUF4352 domain-containing protein n=1 Tax=Nocardia niigatensis TaxID=209249 RepID=UPI000687F8BF|nr:DUF4352 domain-containing protein [Nocardia niigatensis]